ncbi:MAG: PLDc N-terminal domain-containing protein [Verrucomicrobia bacterium]|nr:PLDc N-terminal domain-containing protein [Verrucomicrobiota bacterium]MCH8513733.1 PLDc N-terminal domain-containing protein [Kiritimatiellia bacterium]
MILFVVLFTVVALLTLRRRPMDEIPRFLWTLLIVLLPVAGAIIFCIVHPENLSDEERKFI